MLELPKLVRRLARATTELLAAVVIDGGLLWFVSRLLSVPCNYHRPIGTGLGDLGVSTLPHSVEDAAAFPYQSYQPPSIR